MGIKKIEFVTKTQFFFPDKRTESLCHKSDL